MVCLHAALIFQSAPFPTGKKVSFGNSIKQNYRKDGFFFCLKNQHLIICNPNTKSNTISIR